MDIRIAVCDDNFIFVNEVKQICEEYFASKNENCHVECFSCGEEVLHAVDLTWNVLFCMSEKHIEIPYHTKSPPRKIKTGIYNRE